MAHSRRRDRAIPLSTGFLRSLRQPLVWPCLLTLSLCGLVGCQRGDDTDPVATPPAAQLPDSLDAPATATEPQRTTYEAVGLEADLPDDWQSVEPSADMRLSEASSTIALAPGPGELPMITVVGVPRAEYREMIRGLRAGTTTPDGEADSATNNEAETTAAADADDTDDLSLVAEPLAGPGGLERMESETWTADGLKRGRVYREQLSDSEAEGAPFGVGGGWLELYLGESNAGDLYIVLIISQDEAQLGDSRDVLDSFRFSSPQAASTTDTIIERNPGAAVDTSATDEADGE